MKTDLVKLIKNNPVIIANELGFTRLSSLHNDWIRQMILNKDDTTLLGHRGSYKTTCLSVAISLLMILRPSRSIIFIRKTDTDISEIIEQIKKILKSETIQSIVKVLYGVDLTFNKDNMSMIDTSLHQDTRGTPQLLGIGIGSSITGKHAHYIFTDDIVNLKDRASKAERDRTKAFYQELTNIKDVDGRIFNTGTPWHVDDCISTLMSNVQRYDCYSTGLLSDADISNIKQRMTASLFCANYELRHVASDRVLFSEPQFFDDPSLLENGTMHVDASYGGSDGTAFGVAKFKDGKLYVYGHLRPERHVDDCLDDICLMYKNFLCGKIFSENNADKGYLRKELNKLGLRGVGYHEKMNKFIKITSFAKMHWEDILFYRGTDEVYLREVLDYNEDAEHDDAPDNLACLTRICWRDVDNSDYKSPFF